MLGFLFLVASAVAEPADPLNQLPCDGGGFIFFEPGSDRIEGYATHVLDGLAARLRTSDSPTARVRIESAGDGEGATFDAELSRRRSESIADYLAERGWPKDKTSVQVGPSYRGPGLATRPEDEYIYREAWVSVRITPEEYARRHGPTVIVECF